MRNLTKIAVLVALLGREAAIAETTGAVGTSTTSASAPRIALSGKDSRWSAPIGHRQPRVSDLPPELSGEFEHIDEQDRAVDRKLIICRGC
jgi:hypothetical protein